MLLSPSESEGRRLQMERLKADFQESREHLRTKVQAKKDSPKKASMGPHHAEEKGADDTRLAGISLLQGSDTRGIPAPLSLGPSRLGPALDQNFSSSSSNLLFNQQTGLLPFSTTGLLYPPSLRIAAGGDMATNGLMQHRGGLTEATSRLGAPSMLVGLLAGHTGSPTAASLQLLSLQQQMIHPPVSAVRRPQGLMDAAASETLRRQLAATDLLNEYRRAWLHSQSQERYS